MPNCLEQKNQGVRVRGTYNTVLGFAHWVPTHRCPCRSAASDKLERLVGGRIGVYLVKIMSDPVAAEFRT